MWIMCEQVSLELYHTCEAGDESLILTEAPYKAESNGRQWLGDGYYFWVESLQFAHIWGRRYKKGYCIVKFSLQLNREDLLDLVGSPYDQQKFRQLIKDAASKLGGYEEEITVSTYINFMQKIDVWRWLATKLADFGRMDQIESLSSKMATSAELVFLTPRIQLCLHTEPTDVKIKLDPHGIVYDYRKSKEYKSIKMRVIK